MELHCEVRARDATLLLGVLIAFELALLMLFAASTLLGQPIWTLHALFDLDGEGNIPAWFSSIQLFIVGLIFALLARSSKRGERPSAVFLLVVGAGFMFLSMDEAASLHEKLTRALTRFAWVPRFRGDHGVWVYLYPLLGLGLFIAFLRDLQALWREHQRAAKTMALGLALFFLGAVGFEIVSFFLRSGETPLLYAIEVGAEEFLEMSGISVVLYGTLQLAMADPREDMGPADNVRTAALKRSPVLPG